MDILVDFVLQHAEYAHYLIFGLLMLAGLNVPISEDLMLILSGMLASTAEPDGVMQLFVWTFLGAYLSDWEAYWIGRLFGPKLWETRWFSRLASKKEPVARFYHRYGFFTLLLGRFIPFGVRNCLFISAGMGGMSFRRFLVADGIACLISNLVLFSLAFSFGKNYHLLYDYVRSWNVVIFCVAVLVALGLGLWIWYSYRRKGQQRVYHLD